MISHIFVLLEIILAYLFADFLMGIFHWIKDTYFSPFTPIIGRLFIWGSRLHHVKPRQVIEAPDFELFIDAAKWTLLWMGPLFYLIGPSTFWIAVFLSISINDVVHKYAHMTNSERPKWATLLQNLYIIQSHDIHHMHHVDELHETNYCPITPFVNPIVDGLNIYRKMENIIEKLTGIEPRLHHNDYVTDSKFPAGIRFVPELERINSQKFTTI